MGGKKTDKVGIPRRKWKDQKTQVQTENFHNFGNYELIKLYITSP